MKKELKDLKRALNEMPDDIKEALIAAEVFDLYQARPPYQQNDYLGWIGRAKLPETKKKRLQQMLTELKNGTVYMKMSWKSKEV
ncbi:YdeI/OmpD-associated family protein [Pedobacter caeni]|uniref:Bacteriocin-protection, YdeI or OmpD-Associated n=1 Tax=Pedobacter caeni TaxID=288992 RepID=A0A1M5PY79_9SPHI|nr:YdeI/OmpD-associated family protein [Pedobacter caeni]SHH06612.1 Bacteriocin-protection, YdeI or OmpD-Associated [Pedobacter caeni]